MNLNQFESIGEVTLNQILQTLDHVHGVKFNIDFDDPNIMSVLGECKSLYETTRDRIINESSFNSYQTNPEYIKSMLVLEAVRMLIEIGPKRRRKPHGAYRPRGASDPKGADKPYIKYMDSKGHKRKVSETTYWEAAGEPKTTLATQISDIAAKVPNNSEQSAAFSNALAALADKLANRGTSFNDSKLDHTDLKILRWLKSLPRPINVHDLIASGVETFGDQLKSARDNHIAANKYSHVDEIIAPIPPIGPGQKPSTTPAAPTSTNPLQPQPPGNPANPDDDKEQAIAAIVNNHQNQLIPPEVAREQLKDQGVQDSDINNMLNGQGAANNVSEYTMPDRPASGLDKIVALGREMMDYSTDTTHATSDKALAVLNAFTRVGEKLASMGTAFGPRHLTDTEKKIVRLFQLKIKAGQKQPSDEMAENLVAMKARPTAARPGMNNVIGEQYKKEKEKIKEALNMIKKINEFAQGGFTPGGHTEDLAKAQTIIAAKGITGKVQDMAEDVAKLSVEELMPLVDMMREQFGPEVADGFNSSFKTALDALLQLTTQTKDKLSTAVETLSTGGVPSEMSDLSQTSSDDMMSSPNGGMSNDSDIANDLSGNDDFGADDLGDDSSGGIDEPLGRAKKDDVAEGKKGKLPPWLEKGKDGKVVKKGAGDKKADEKKTDKKNVKESAPPGRKAEHFIKKSKGDFKERYGNKWQERLYATAWKNFGPKSESYDKAQQVMLETKEKMAKLESKMLAHKKSFSKLVNEGKSSDPLGVGYGLQGDAIMSQINRLNKKITEAKSIMLHEMKQGISSLLFAIKNEKKAAALSEAKKHTPYGVIYITQSGNKSCKMFENMTIRNHWLTLRGNTISKVQMIEPETFDRAINKTIAR